MNHIIKVSNISKTFGGQPVLENVNLTVRKGEILGLLGPNGAGKTTFIRILNGVIKPDTGEISILGFNPSTQGNEIRKISGIVTESAGLYHQMSGLENLSFFAALYGVKGKSEIQKLLRLFDLEEHQHKPAGMYSTGMKKRLALAKALLHRPTLLFLDEPTNGLDPEGIKMVLSYLKKYNEETGTTMIICSHVLHQLETICASFAFINNRSIIEQGTLMELETKYIKNIKVKIETDLKYDDTMDLGFLCQQIGESTLSFELPSKSDIPALLSEILKNHSVYSVNITNNDLEAIYFKVREDKYE